MKKITGLILMILIGCSGCSQTTSTTPKTTYSAEEILQMAQQTIDARTTSQNGGLIIQPVEKTASDISIIQNPQRNTPQTIQAPTVVTPQIIPTIQVPQIQPTANYVQPVTSVCDRIRFLDDITVEDNTLMQPGQIFRKTWRIQNAGSCTWTPGYQLVFAGGTVMGNTYAVNLPAQVPSGGTVDVSVDLTAPLTSGTYQSNWKLRSPSGNVFGTSNSSNDAIWAKIVVGTNANYATVAPNTNVINTGCSVLSVTPAYKASFQRGSETDFEIRVQNTGNTAWTSQSMDLAYIGGENMLKRKDQSRRDMPYDVAPGGTFYFAMDAVVPDYLGVYTMSIGIVNGYEVLCTMNITINVIN